MKNIVFSIFLGLFLTFSSFSYAESKSPVELEQYCGSVGATAGSISQAFQSGKTIKDLEVDFSDPEFLTLTPVEQEFVRTLARFILFAGPDMQPIEHYMGAMGACFEFGGDLKALTKALNDVLKQNLI